MKQLLVVIWFLGFGVYISDSVGVFLSAKAAREFLKEGESA